MVHLSKVRKTWLILGISRFTSTICTKTTSSTIEQLCFDTNPVARRVLEPLGANNTSSLPIHVSKQYQSGSRNARLIQINADVPVLARTQVLCLFVFALEVPDVALFINSFYQQFVFFCPRSTRCSAFDKQFSSRNL